MKHIPVPPFTAGRAKNRRLYIYDHTGATICSGFSSLMQPEKVAAKLSLAANKTYGAGINPEAVPDMLAALKSFQGLEAWINDRQMKEMFQSKLYAAIEKASL